MLIKIYAVRDVKGSNYVRPFFAVHEADATRQFTSAIRDPQTVLGQYPSDFELMEIATFDDLHGMVTGNEQPKYILGGQTVVQIDLAKKVSDANLVQKMIEKNKETK